MKLFPSGIAMGSAFCNRNQERQQLKDNIHNTEHTVLLAPRRYGKTSLTNKVMDEIAIDHAWVELFSITSFESAERKIASAVGELIFKLSPDVKKLQIKIKKFFQQMKPEIVLSGFGQKIVLHPLTDTLESITKMLMEIDLFAQSVHKKVVIVFDEFQQIAELKDGKAIEACIRQAVERSKAVTYIFSGSNRHMLTEIFGHSSRPLYRLCKLLTLDRMSCKSYESFIQKAAMNKWKKKFDEVTFSQIMTLTERHPYYTNLLCEQLWKQKNQPKYNDIEHIWKEYVFTHKKIIISDIINLSVNQKKCINALANHPTREPFGQEFQHKTKLSISSLKQVINVLYEKDIIFKDENNYVKLLDPAIAYLIRES